MKPALLIPLLDHDLQLLGELTAIIGQIDEMMAALVARLISADRATANIIMGSSKVADNANIWAALIRARTDDEDKLWILEHALQEIAVVSGGRNDFVHAFYAFEGYRVKEVRKVEGMNHVLLEAYPLSARRVRTPKKRPVSELQSVRDQAARLSCLVAHIGHLVNHPPQSTHPPSPWLERLASSLPPRLDTVAARKAKAQLPRRPPSQPSLRQRRRDRRLAKD